MPRRRRFYLPHVPIHVRQRGNDRAALFPDDDHRRLYLGLLGELAPVFECDIHAYVLMPNHVHLLATPGDPVRISALMKNLGQRYVQHFNRAHSHCGSRLDGRYRGNMVGDEAYFLTCQRYVELNPVRAGMVAHPAEFPWSSYRANAHGAPSLLLTPHPIYLSLGHSERVRRLQYSMLVEDGVSDNLLHEIRVASLAGAPFASAAFIARAEQELGMPSPRSLPGRKKSSAMRETGSDPGLE